MKILIYSMNFWPEPTSTGKYSGEMAVWLAARGHDVRVIAAPPYYPEWKVADGYSAFRYRKDVHAGVDIRRCPVWIPQRPNGWKRILCMLLFAISCLWEAAKSLIWRPDMVMVVEPPISCAPVAWLFAKLAGAKTWQPSDLCGGLTKCSHRRTPTRLPTPRNQPPRRWCAGRVPVPPAFAAAGAAARGRCRRQAWIRGGPAVGGGPVGVADGGRSGSRQGLETPRLRTRRRSGGASVCYAFRGRSSPRHAQGPMLSDRAGLVDPWKTRELAEST